MTATARPLNRPVPGYMEYPALAAAPGVSPTNGGRIYTDGSSFYFSAGGAAYATAGVTLDGAYDTGGAGAGRSITADTGAVAISNGAAVANGLLSLSELNTTTNGNVGLSYTRAVTPSGGITYTGSGLTISNTPTATNTFTENGTLLSVSHVPIAGAGLITDTTTGIAVTMTPLATSAVRGISITMGATVGGVTASGLVITSTQTSGQCIFINMTPGLSGAGDGIRIAINEFATSIDGIDITNNSTAGYGVITRMQHTEGTITAVGLSSQRVAGAAGYFSGKLLEVDNRPASNSESGYLVWLNHAPASTGADTTTGILLTMTPSTAASSVSGVSVTMSFKTGSAGYAATFVAAGTAGEATGNAIVNITRVRTLGAESNDLAGQTVGLEIDLVTTTPGAFAHIGQRILIPATTRANTALEAALVIDSQATAARVLDLALANTTGTPIIVRWRAATTPDAVVMVTLDCSTNVTTNTNGNIALDLTMLAADRMTSAPLRANGARLFVNDGVPIDANGLNGDVYWDTSGSKVGFRPTFYQRQAGAWAAIA